MEVRFWLGFGFAQPAENALIVYVGSWFEFTHWALIHKLSVCIRKVAVELFGHCKNLPEIREMAGGGEVGGPRRGWILVGKSSKFLAK